MKTILYHFNVIIIGLEERNIQEISTLVIKYELLKKHILFV